MRASRTWRRGPTGGAQVVDWLRVGEVLRPAAAWPPGANGHGEGVAMVGQLLPDIPGTARTVAVRQPAELLGALSVRKRPGESLTPIEEKLLEDLARQAGL